MTKFLLASEAGGISFLVLFAVMTIAVFAVAVWLICLGLKGDVKFKLKPKYIFFIVLAVGAALRMLVAFSMRGLVGMSSANTVTRTGYNGLFNMTYDLIYNGFTDFWAKYEGAFYYPITMYILAFFGSICSLFSPLSISSEATLIFIKLPFIISDILLALAVYKIAEKFAGEIVALAIGGFVAICPVFMLSSIWPSAYTFFALALVIMLYLMLERKYIHFTIVYSISLLICFEAIFLLPAVAVFLIYAYVKRVAAYRQEQHKQPLWQSEYGLIVKLPVAIIICLVCSYLLTLPFALGSVGANPFAMLYALYLKPFDNFEYFTYNGLSLYNVFVKNGIKLNLSFPTYVFSLLFAVAVIIVTLIIYLTKKNRANLAMFISYLLLTINVYFVNTSELTLLPFIAATLIAFVILKDKRLLQIAGLISLLVFINATGVLIKAEYFAVNATYVSEVLNNSWLALSITVSVITIICHLYYTAVLLDIVMNGRIKKLATNDNKFISSIKGLIKIKD
ncbi:MAG: hypothetical protein J1F36_03895 [Clostridiales bacterium]|nr:hypothetical protein [Clostridiales bacterium]